MKHGILLRRTLSCFLTLMLFFSTGTAAFSEAAAPGEPDLDLTALSGTVLLNRLAEIQGDPDRSGRFRNRILVHRHHQGFTGGRH